MKVDDKPGPKKAAGSSVIALTSLGVLIWVLTWPAAHINLLLVAAIGFIAGSILGRAMLSIDHWLLVPATWGAAIATLIFTVVSTPLGEPSQAGWIATGILVTAALAVLVADQAGYDFRGRRIDNKL